jgi:hypothetical protein
MSVDQARGRWRHQGPLGSKQDRGVAVHLSPPVMCPPQTDLRARRRHRHRALARVESEARDALEKRCGEVQLADYLPENLSARKSTLLMTIFCASL